MLDAIKETPVITKPKEPPAPSLPDTEFGTTLKDLNIELTPEQLSRLKIYREARTNTINAKTKEVADIYELVEELEEKGWDIGHEQLQLTGDIFNEETSTSTQEILSRRIAEYVKTPEGQRDSQIALMRTFINNPANLGPEKIQQLAQERGIKPGFIRRSLSESQLKDLHNQIKRDLNLYGYGADDFLGHDEGKRFAAENAFDMLVRDSCKRFLDTLEEERGKMSNQYSKPKSPDEITAIMRSCEDLKENTRQQFLERVAHTDITDLVSGLTRGDITVEQLLQHANERIRGSLNFGQILYEILSPENRVIEGIFRDASLLGITFETVDESVVKGYHERINELLQKLGFSTQDPDVFLDQIKKQIERNRETMSLMIDTEDTLYWHFTPNARKIFKDKMLKSGAHEGMENFTGGHSLGVHFIKPGQWHEEDATSLSYTMYAESWYTSRVKQIETPLGVGIIFPLGSIMAITPYRNEHKTTSSEDGHLSPNATFRAPEGEVLYGYDLMKAYIIPMHSSAQVPFEERVIIDEKTGKRTMRSLAEPVKKALREAGYSEKWIQEHVIDSSGISSKSEQLREATKEVKERLERKRSGTETAVVLPIRSQVGQWEQLDVHGHPAEGSFSTPYIEELTSARRRGGR